MLLTPFHNRALMCPATTAADVDMHTELFEAAVRQPLRLVEQPPRAEDLLGEAAVRQLHLTRSCAAPGGPPSVPG